MKFPEQDIRETERLAELSSYSILDSMPEEDYDNLTAIASQICDTPISLVSLIDSKRQWFKSSHGLDVSETPRELAFCSHAINDSENVMMIEDARKDERFMDNPLVTGEPNVIFYTGVPLVTENGLPLGTLCVIDTKPKVLTPYQLKSLKALSKQIMVLMELRKKKRLLEETLTDLEERNKELERYEFISVHDLKTPLISISSMTHLLSQQFGIQIGKDGIEMLDSIRNSSNKLKDLISGLLEYNRNENQLLDAKSWVNLSGLISEIESLFTFEDELSFTLSTSLTEIHANKAAANQLIINLIANTLKQNDKKVTNIEISITEDDSSYKFSSSSLGLKIEPKSPERILRIMDKLSKKDNFGKIGNGIGLATVHKIVEKNGGKVAMESKPDGGSSFVFSLGKSQVIETVNN